MDKVKFIDDIYNVETSELVYKKGSEHEVVAEDKDNYYVHDPKSPKDKNWVSRFPKKSAGNRFYFTN